MIVRLSVMAVPPRRDRGARGQPEDSITPLLSKDQERTVIPAGVELPRVGLWAGVGEEI